MFERFTDRSRAAVVAAQEEARGLHHGYVGTEHLLLSLASGDGVAAKALARVGFDRPRFLGALGREVGMPDQPHVGMVPFTPRLRKALEESLRQSLSWGHNYIGTEHLLMGVLHDDSSLATKLAAEQGVSATEVEPAVLGLLTDLRAERAPGPGATGTVGTERTEGAPADVVHAAGVQPARCPACAEPLATNLAADLIASVGDVERTFAVAYCGACGHTLAVLPDD